MSIDFLPSYVSLQCYLIWGFVWVPCYIALLISLFTMVIITTLPSICWHFVRYCVLFSTYPKELTTYVHTKSCTWIFIADLFITGKNGKQLKCLSIGEWVSELQYGHIMEYYSMIRGNKLSRHKQIWKKLIALCQVKEASGVRLHTIWNSGKGKTRDSK